MRKFAGFVTSLSLGMALAAGASAHAQEAAPAQASTASTVKLDVGTTVYDSEGAAIGPIASVEGGNVVLTVGDKPIALPATSFLTTDKGPAITVTLAQLTEALNKQTADAAAALQAAMQPGAEVHSAQGAAVVGKIKLADAEGIVLTTTEGGDIRIPRDAFFMSQAGLAVSFTAEQFAAAVAEANASGATQPDAVADGAAPATDPAPTPAD